MSAWTLTRESSGMVRSEGKREDRVRELLAVCSRLKLPLDRLDPGLVSSVLGSERSAEPGCGTELRSL